jgi:transcriptional repressor NrdR
VKDSRPSDDHAVIRRRRICPDCGGRFTTFERVQLRELVVVKRSGRRIPFEREKLHRSVEVALRKRPVDAERIERMVNGIVRQLESLGDDVAYVRFASVYRNFREAKDFEDLLDELTADEPEPGPKG